MSGAVFSLLRLQALAVTQYGRAIATLHKTFGFEGDFTAWPIDQYLPDLRNIPFSGLFMALDRVNREWPHGSGRCRVVQRNTEIGDIKKRESGGT